MEDGSDKLTFKQNFLLRIQQESTWRGIISVLALFGVQIFPDAAENIISGAVSLIAAINIMKSD